MTIHAYEGDESLEPADVIANSTLHMRCGTSFLLIVMVIAIALFSLIGDVSWPWKIVSRLIGIPLISGLSYEVIRFAGRHQDNPVVRLIMMPGLGLQRMTTRQPDESQVAVAIAALKAVLEKDSGETENLAMP